MEDILIGEGLTSKRKLHRSVENKRKKIAAQHREEASAVLKKIRNLRQRRLLDKTSGPLQ